jgi:hypothetical protein
MQAVGSARAALRHLVAYLTVEVARILRVSLSLPGSLGRSEVESRSDLHLFEPPKSAKNAKGIRYHLI